MTSILDREGQSIFHFTATAKLINQLHELTQAGNLQQRQRDTAFYLTEEYQQHPPTWFISNLNTNQATLGILVPPTTESPIAYVLCNVWHSLNAFQNPQNSQLITDLLPGILTPPYPGHTWQEKDPSFHTLRNTWNLTRLHEIQGGRNKDHLQRPVYRIQISHKDHQFAANAPARNQREFIHLLNHSENQTLEGHYHHEIDAPDGFILKNEMWLRQITKSYQQSLPLVIYAKAPKENIHDFFLKQKKVKKS